jgi:WhiB family transcriptional regulator, redox-sensing transcriptional regulator
MAYEHADFGRHDPFGIRAIGSVGNTRHTITGPTPNGATGRPQLSVVPVQPERLEVASTTTDD